MEIFHLARTSLKNVCFYFMKNGKRKTEKSQWYRNGEVRPRSLFESRGQSYIPPKEMHANIVNFARTLRIRESR